MVEPITCVPSAALIIPAATPAAEPLLDPPGVRRRSCGLRVPRGSLAANSVVTVFPHDHRAGFAQRGDAGGIALGTEARRTAASRSRSACRRSR
jgi:hypothetical protein